MLPKATPHNQPNLFYGSLMDILDRNDPLIALAHAIDWKSIEEALRGYYALDKGRPAKPFAFDGRIIDA